eukprot:SAG11_NODE_2426_length_3376_cov_4.541044_2_plen_137_part_00
MLLQAFSNPNGGMAVHTLNWLSSCAADAVRTACGIREQEPSLYKQRFHRTGQLWPFLGSFDLPAGDPTDRETPPPRPQRAALPSTEAFDLLELFCGNGNHTVRPPHWPPPLVFRNGPELTSGRRHAAGLGGNGERV